MRQFKLVVGIILLMSMTVSFKTAVAQTYCQDGNTVTVTGTIRGTMQNVTKDKWALVLEKSASPCHADVVLQSPNLPTNCKKGNRVTASGKVALFNNSPTGPLVPANRVQCFR